MSEKEEKKENIMGTLGITRLIMKMSSSLPWGFMEENLEDVKIEAKRKMEEEKIKTSEGEE